MLLMRWKYPENMLSLQFPNELKEFYLQIGYGYLGYDNPNFRNQIMHPLEIAKLKLGLDFYGNMYEEDLKYYTSESVFPFFDLGGEADYLVIQMTEVFFILMLRLHQVLMISLRRCAREQTTLYDR